MSFPCPQMLLFIRDLGIARCVQSLSLLSFGLLFCWSRLWNNTKEWPLSSILSVVDGVITQSIMKFLHNQYFKKPHFHDICFSFPSQFLPYTYKSDHTKRYLRQIFWSPLEFCTANVPLSFIFTECLMVLKKTIFECLILMKLNFQSLSSHHVPKLSLYSCWTLVLSRMDLAFWIFRL